MAEREKITEWIIRHNKYWDELWDFTKAAPDSKKTYIAKCIENYGYHKHASDDKVADGEKKVLNGRRGNERDYWKVCTRVAIDPDGCHLIGIMEDDGLSLRNRHNLIELMNRHFISIEAFPDHVVHEKDLGLGMIDEIVDIPGLELMKNGNHDGTVSHGGEVTHRPVDLVAGADGHLVSFVEEALLESDVQLFDPSGHVAIAEADSLIV